MSQTTSIVVFFFLSQVPKHVRVLLVPLQIVPRYQVLHTLLDGFDIRLEHSAKLLNALRDKLLMSQHFLLFMILTIAASIA